MFIRLHIFHMIKKILATLIIFSFFASLSFANAQDVTSQSDLSSTNLSNIKVPTPTLPVGFKKPGKISGIDPVFSTTTSQTVTLKDTGVFSNSPISVSGIKINGQEYSAGDTMSGQAFLENRSNNDQNDVYLDISLVGNYSNEVGREGLPNTIYNTKTVGPFVVKAGVVTPIDFSYLLPKSVGGKGLGIEINAHSVSGLPYGWNDVRLKEISGGQTLLDITDAFTSINGKRHLPQSGPTLNASTTVNFNLQVKNNSTSSITVTPSIDIHDRMSSGPLVQQYSDKTTTIPAKSSKDFVFKPYENNQKPGVYVADISLIGRDGNAISPLSEYRYIIPGEIATIHEVKIAQNSVSNNDNVNINVFYSGSPHDMQTGEREKIYGAVLNVQLINAQTGEVLGEASTTPNLDIEAANSTLSVQVKGSATTIKSLATITVDGRELASYSTSPSVPDPSSTDDVYNNKITAIYIAVLVLVAGLILISLFYFIRKKTSRNALMAIAILLSLVASGFITQKITNAVVVYNSHTTWGLAPGCPWVPETITGPRHNIIVPGHFIPCSYPDTSWNSIVVQSPTNTSIIKGQTIPVSGYVYSYGCGNTPENLSLAVSIRDANGKDVSQAYSSYWHYDNHVGTEVGAPGEQWSRFSFNIPQDLPPGNYYISVTTYEDWVGNGIWEHAGYLTDYTAITISEPKQNIDFATSTAMRTTCSVSTTTADINQPVTWSLNTTGGVPPYKYQWSENSNLLADNSATVVRGYTVPGQVNMAYSVKDNLNNPLYSTVTGWLQCPQTLTITSAVNHDLNDCISPDGSVIANGSSKNYSSTTDSGFTCGSVTNYTCTNGVLSLASKSALLCQNSTGDTGTGGDGTGSSGGGTSSSVVNVQDANIIDHDYGKPVTIISFSMKPNTVNKDNPCNMNLDVQNARQCWIQGENVNPAVTTDTNRLGIHLSDIGNVSTTVASGPITATTRFTLNCLGQSEISKGKYPLVSRSAQCFLNPAPTEK